MLSKPQFGDRLQDYCGKRNSVFSVKRDKMRIESMSDLKIVDFVLHTLRVVRVKKLEAEHSASRFQQRYLTGPYRRIMPLS